MLYMDCDILVNDSLQELWRTDIEGYACAVVEDQEADDITLQNRIGVYGTPYFNSGYCWSIWTIGGSIMWHVGWWSSSGNIRRSAFSGSGCFERGAARNGEIPPIRI